MLSRIESILSLNRIINPKKMKTAPRMNRDKWTFYLDRNREWRWTRNSLANGKIVGASSEGFSSKTNCIANAKRNGFYGN